jgi:nucleolar MIF4G domain-containing protein 1
LRKQERTGKKQRKAEFFSVAAKRGAEEEEHTDSPQRKKIKLSAEAVSNAPAPAPPKPTRTVESIEEGTKAKVVKPVKKAKTALEKLVGRSDPAGRRSEPTPASLGPRSLKDKEEDAYMAYLESKLGYTKNKGSREDDGLDGV